MDGLVPRLFAPDNEWRMPDKVERAKQNVTRVTLGQTGHMGMMEAPVALSAAIVHWIQNG